MLKSVYYFELFTLKYFAANTIRPMSFSHRANGAAMIHFRINALQPIIQNNSVVNVPHSDSTHSTG